MIKANIVMKDGTELKEVLLFKTKELGDSEIKTKEYAKYILSGQNDKHAKHIYVCGKYIQGGIIPQQIASYEIIDDEKEVRESLLNFIKEENTIYDLNYSDVIDFIMDNRETLQKILK